MKQASDSDRRLPRWQMLIIKIFDRPRYRKLRDIQYRLKILKRIERYASTQFRITPPVEGRPGVFKHSGNAGDIIYSLPCVKALSRVYPARLRLMLDVPLRDKTIEHPLGNLMLNKRMFDMLRPLLEAQDYIESVSIHDGSPVDFDLDEFRDSPLPLERLNISRWYFYFHGVCSDLSKPWLRAPVHSAYSDTVVLARSARYRNTALDYGFLARYPRLLFVGLESEFLDMKKSLPNLEWHPVVDFLELASLIASCRLFIGNQSFPFSLAEACKVPRILETDPLGPNVVPCGDRAYDVLFQKQLEHLVRAELD